MVETSYFELCFLLPVLLKNLDNCFFLSMLLICYYTTVFRVQNQNRWYGRHLLKSASVCFCPKMPRNYVHCLPPSPPCLPLNVQLTLSGRKVNISKVPNYMQLETCTSQKAFEAWYGNRVNYRKYTILRCFA